MAWRFARGRGGVDLGEHERRPLADDFGRQAVAYTSIGLFSTLISFALFLLLRDQVGAVWANAIAFTATAIGNSWAHRRWTFRRRSDEDRGWRIATSLAVFTASLVGISVALAAVAGDPTAEVVVLGATWAAAGLLRFVVLRTWVYRR
jgi:putative flippase GtrA